MALLQGESTLLAKKSVHGRMRGVRIHFLAISAAILAAILAGCGKVQLPDVEIPWVYKIDIQQGNVVTQEMLDKLKPGMEKRKVRFILGTPLIVSAFGKDRWDYIYHFQPGGGEREQRRISVFFQNGKLHHMQGNIVPNTPAAKALPWRPRLKQDRRLPTGSKIDSDSR